MIRQFLAKEQHDVSHFNLYRNLAVGNDNLILPVLTARA
jgi:hypothetical protein